MKKVTKTMKAKTRAKKNVDGNVRVVNILGTDYTIEEKTVKEDTKLENSEGYCDPSIKKIVVLRESEGGLLEAGDFEKVKQATIIHETLHAFLFESGINDNALKGVEELVVEWMALQLPKIVKTFKELGVLE